MLEEARRRHAAGEDVAVVFVAARGRPAIDTLAHGLPKIAGRRIEHLGITAEEMDLDAILARRPGAVVVDDLAHVSAPGGRHARRWQEVEPLLAAGIDVLATLGTYQLESLNEIVETLTGVDVRETVPDGVLRRADSVVHVDVEPAALLARLEAGLIYGPERRSWAQDRWFAPTTFDALRELAFRQVAEALAARQGEPVQAATRPVSGRVMVCLSSFSPRALALLRRGSRIAGRLNTDWFVVYVETPREAPARMPEAVRKHLATSVEKARELGAEVVFLQARDPVKALLEFAQARGVAHVVIGRSPALSWRDRLGLSMVARMVRAFGGLDVYLLATEEPR
jgi:two-component system sensor histidine kinase KdpD